MLGSIDPVGVNPRSQERLPFWNPHTSTPNITVSDSRFNAVAFNGAITDPVITNKIANVISAISTATSGSLLITPSV